MAGDRTALLPVPRTIHEIIRHCAEELQICMIRMMSRLGLMILTHLMLLRLCVCMQLWLQLCVLEDRLVRLSALERAAKASGSDDTLIQAGAVVVK